MRACTPSFKVGVKARALSRLVLLLSMYWRSTKTSLVTWLVGGS
jgi:hypothetical protein